MFSEENVLSFLDLLDLDEELVDSRLKCIMSREKYENKHLTSAIQLLQYKHLVNLRETSECENDKECEFVVKLIKRIDMNNVENVCKIISITLCLNTSTLVNRSEHLIQQILCDLPAQVDSDEATDSTSTILILKVIDSILQAVIQNNLKLNLPFIELPLKNILLSSNENIVVHFLGCTVPKLFEAVTDFNILDSIWNFVKHFIISTVRLPQSPPGRKNFEGIKLFVSLTVLSSLSDYYLPAPDHKGNVLYESNIIHEYEFWKIILDGMLSTDSLLRKISIYLAKRALDCVITQKIDVCVTSESTVLFKWCKTESKSLKVMWDNYFILIDSLEEKQSNIVLPSLQLFTSLKNMGHWLNCAFNIGLKHDNNQVRLKCIHYRLQTKLSSQQEAIVLLDALNTIHIYEDSQEVEEIKNKLSTLITEQGIFIHIFTSIPLIKWSPVPFYQLTGVLAEEKLKTNISIYGQKIISTLIDILKIPCNNVPLRKAAHINISHFVGNCCTMLNWTDCANIYLMFKTDLLLCLDNPFLSLVSQKLRNEDERTFCEFILQSYLNIDIGLYLLEYKKYALSLYIDLLCEKFKKVDDILSRSYSDKRECMDDVIYISQLICKTNVNQNSSSRAINDLLSFKYKTVILYVSSLLVNNTMLSIEEITLISNGLSYISNMKEIKEDLLQVYQTSMLLIKYSNVALESIVLGIHIINSLTSNKILLKNYKHELLRLQDILSLTTNFVSKNSIGRLRNVFYEKSCEIVAAMLSQQDCDVNRHIEAIIEYIATILDCGGYGCLLWCLKIINSILPLILTNKNINFNMIQFMNRMWKEIEELKSNNQYASCIEEFVSMITHDELLKTPEYNNIVILYTKNIIDYGSVKVTPLFYLMSKLNSKVLTSDYGHVVYILCEILLLSPVPRKDQRIVDNLVVEVLKDPKYGFNKTEIDTHFNFQVQYLSLLALSKIKDPEILCIIEKFIINRIDELFRNKQRYHGHSQAHRTLLAGLQHLLLISLMKSSNDMETFYWCIDFLSKLPHQPSIRICLEWYIASQLYMKDVQLNKELLRKLKDIPQISQLLIMYFTYKRIIFRAYDVPRYFDVVMDFLLHHTMGQNFNTRLHAQYLASKLYGMFNLSVSKYPFIMTVVNETLKESENDKNYVKLKNDYFINDFDISMNFTPSFIYYFLPRYCEINNNELVDLDYVKNVLVKVDSNIAETILNTDFHKEWLDCHKSNEEVFSLNLSNDNGRKLTENLEATGTIQKKYVPWKNMSDINIYKTEKKKESKSELIVVASLIDKLPNLGGMARTSEVFGVKTYVVDSLRHLQDKQFQNLSVSAERWINVEEVRPGRPLKDYLIARKSEGYCVVAAEQTSTSVQLQTFRFPLKTILLLGHEKEGIPCDLLPFMDYCVEIPQQGFVRSLNVHVTAAIFVWEYARQNIL